MTLDLQAAITDAERGVVDRRIFWDRALYDLELEHIFARSWLFVAHESQVAEPGSFLTTYMGEDAVIVARDTKGALGVVLNSCPHRGNRVCFADEGKARTFICNYHGWVFGLDGALRGMPAAELYEQSPGFDKKDWGLRRARTGTYKGLIFACWDESAPPLEDWLGDFRWYLDAVLDAVPGGTEFLPGVQRSTLNCNWKFPADNFAGDIYHALWTHLGGAAPTLGAKGGVLVDQEQSYQVNVNGHGWEFGQNIYGNAAVMGDREVNRHMRDRHEAVVQRLGEVRAKMCGAVSSANIFPNFAFLGGFFTFRLFQPKGPLKTELHAWTLVPKELAPELKDRWRRGVMRTFSPSGTLEMDDGENWEHSTSANSGVVTRRQKLCYGLAPEGAPPPADMPGTVHRGQLSDANQRAFYRHWAEMMAAKAWSDIPLAPVTRAVEERA